MPIKIFKVTYILLCLSFLWQSSIVAEPFSDYVTSKGERLYLQPWQYDLVPGSVNPRSRDGILPLYYSDQQKLSRAGNLPVRSNPAQVWGTMTQTEEDVLRLRRGLGDTSKYFESEIIKNNQLLGWLFADLGNIHHDENLSPEVWNDEAVRVTRRFFEILMDKSISATMITDSNQLILEKALNRLSKYDQLKLREIDPEMLKQIAALRKKFEIAPYKTSKQSITAGPCNWKKIAGAQ